jgi:hypothetical protein
MTPEFPVVGEQEYRKILDDRRDARAALRIRRTVSLYLGVILVGAVLVWSLDDWRYAAYYYGPLLAILPRLIKKLRDRDRMGRESEVQLASRILGADSAEEYLPPHSSLEERRLNLEMLASSLDAGDVPLARFSAAAGLGVAGLGALLWGAGAAFSFSEGQLVLSLVCATASALFVYGGWWATKAEAELRQAHSTLEGEIEKLRVEHKPARLGSSASDVA